MILNKSYGESYIYLVKPYSYTIANGTISLATISGECTRQGEVFRKENNAYSSFLQIILKKKRTQVCFY